MAVTVVCECSRTFELKDEFAGTVVKCPQCGATTKAGAAPKPVDPVFGRDVFLLRQRVAINERYTVTDEQGEPLIFIERPAHFLRNLGAALGGFLAAVFTFGFLAILIPVPAEGLLSDVIAIVIMLLALVAGVGAGLGLSKKRHVSFYAGADTSAPRVIEILQDHKVRFPTQTYTVRDDQGRRLGILSKNYLYNVFRKQWAIRDWRGKPVSIVKEDSVILSLLRRLLGPAFGLLRTNFVFLQFGNERELGEFKRKLTILDRYVLDLKADTMKALDRRLAVAAAVMLDSAERR
jgi:hypothetical protein